MTPKDTSNLDNFERVYSQFNKCQLVAVEIAEQMHEPTRNALEWDDDPIIPESETTTAPVIELMKNLREIHDKMGR